MFKTSAKLFTYVYLELEINLHPNKEVIICTAIVLFYLFKLFYCLALSNKVLQLTGRCNTFIILIVFNPGKNRFRSINVRFSFYGLD